ncbi:unnamed protein product [Mycena citricolor]|uniref:Uncharacterized protein n=1 Tax=Mycena citricolor TaxID=2018698 RepID=A0AAD2GT43_9AGAR|nr:unnamed protein product [Mycena citricolor]
MFIQPRDEHNQSLALLPSIQEASVIRFHIDRSQPVQQHVPRNAGFRLKSGSISGSSPPVSIQL